jgi:hypothetical protein
VVIAGHSGYATYIAGKRKVSRLVMFAEPSDHTSVPAPWIHATHDTPTDRYFGFDHTEDTILPDLYQHVTKAWTALGMSGAPVSVDGAAPSSGHKLTTSRTCTSPCVPHLSIVEDKADYEGTWRYMMGSGN